MDKVRGIIVRNEIRPIDLINGWECPMLNGDLIDYDTIFTRLENKSIIDSCSITCLGRCTDGSLSNFTLHTYKCPFYVGAFVEDEKLLKQTADLDFDTIPCEITCRVNDFTKTTIEDIIRNCVLKD